MTHEKTQLALFSIGCMIIASCTIASLQGLHSFVNRINTIATTKVQTQSVVRKVILKPNTNTIK